MSDDIRSLQVIFGLSSFGFGLCSVVNCFVGYHYLHYWRLKEMSVSDFLAPNFPKRSKDYLIRGKVECKKPLEVPSTQSKIKGIHIGPVVYSKHSAEVISQNGSVMHRNVDLRFRDFELTDERSQLMVEIGEKSEFLARNVYKKTSFSSFGLLTHIWHVILEILSKLFWLNINYKTGQR